jgi:hypothetical protein
MRTRWTAIGAAIAITLGAGGIGITNAISTNGGAVFVPIPPCRLFDTRPGINNVGQRDTPLGSTDTLTQQVTGDNGNCTALPADASAISLNVTTLASTGDSFLTIFPADLASPPLASNLNWRAGDPPTPNKVDVKLSPTGAIKLYNFAGDVHVLADVVGYYQDHNHDDRYSTRAQTDAALATKADASAVYTKSEVDGIASRVVAIVNGPLPTVTLERTLSVSDTIVTPIAGRLHLTKPLQFVSVTCSSSAGINYFLLLDGVPVPSTTQITGNTGLEPAVFSGVTGGVVPAGAHTVGLGAECQGAATANVGTSLGNPGPLTVLIIN